MAKNSRKHRKALKLKVGLPIPRTPPGYKRTGNLLHDLSTMYGPTALNDSGIRARIRREYKGRIEVELINEEWQFRAADASEEN